MSRNYFLEGLASIGQGLASIGEGMASMMGPRKIGEFPKPHRQWNHTVITDLSDVTLDSPPEKREALADMLDEMADLREGMAKDFDNMQADMAKAFGKSAMPQTNWVRDSAAKDRERAAALRKGR